MLHAGCSADSNSLMKSLNESSQSGFVSFIYLVVCFGSLEKKSANATPMNAPNSVNDALSNATSNAPVTKTIPPTMVVLMFENIRSIILSSFKDINFSM